MTKTLTEQWRDGTLSDGFYYMQDYTGMYHYHYLLGVKPDSDFVKCFKEVLAPVPSYEEYVELLKKIDELEKNLAGTEQAVQEVLEINEELKTDNEKLRKQLDIAVNALECYANPNTWCCCEKNHCSFVDGSTADIALKEMKEVK